MNFWLQAPNPEGYPSEHRIVEPSDGEAVDPPIEAYAEVADSVLAMDGFDAFRRSKEGEA
jgi:hypothetical protein